MSTSYEEARQMVEEQKTCNNGDPTYRICRNCDAKCGERVVENNRETD